MGAGRDVIAGGGDLQVTDPSQYGMALPVLRGFGGVGRLQDALWTRDQPEEFIHPSERLRFVDLARDRQHRVVGLVVIAVEGPQVGDRHTLDILARSDGGLAVVVPKIGGGHDPLHQHARGVVLTGFELVAHHGELALEVFLLDEGIDHAVGFEVEGPAQVVVGGREGLEIVGAVIPGGAVRARPTGGEFLRDVGVSRRALEHHVFEQMSHAALAVAFVAGADEVGDVHGDGRLGSVREEE